MRPVDQLVSFPTRLPVYHSVQFFAYPLPPSLQAPPLSFSIQIGLWELMVWCRSRVTDRFNWSHTVQDAIAVMTDLVWHVNPSAVLDGALKSKDWRSQLSKSALSMCLMLWTSWQWWLCHAYVTNNHLAFGQMIWIYDCFFRNNCSSGKVRNLSSTDSTLWPDLWNRHRTGNGCWSVVWRL